MEVNGHPFVCGTVWNDFTKLNGIIGIFGKNFSGKSSIIDSFLYTLYNSASKSVRKNLNIIIVFNPNNA